MHRLQIKLLDLGEDPEEEPDSAGLSAPRSSVWGELLSEKHFQGSLDTFQNSNREHFYRKLFLIPKRTGKVPSVRF